MIKPLTYFLSIFTILIFLSFQQILFSQNVFTIGIKAGIVLNENVISGESISSYTNGFNKPGISLGVSLGITKSKYFTLLAEVNYLERGMNYNLRAGSTNQSNPRTHYLSFDVLPEVKYRNKTVTPYLFLGPRYEILLNYNKVIQVDGNTLQTPYLYGDIFGFIAGIGAEKQISKNINLNCEIRYGRDLTNSVQVSEMLSVINYYKNSSFNFLLGVNYVLGSFKK